MSISKNTYIIIGAGASGLHLALQMVTSEFFRRHEVIILEKEEKNQADKTWSFWEKGQGNWDHIIKKQWAVGDIFAQGKRVEMILNPYRYKTISSLDFYNEAKKVITSCPNITWKHEEAMEVKSTLDEVKVSTNQATYKADYVFDSRLPDLNRITSSDSNLIYQHFLGWEVKTEAPTFNPDCFTMMDYRIKDGETTSFTYVLPFSPTQALVEFTYFSPSIVSKEVYENHLKKYMSEILQVEDFKLVSTEKGIIPMTTFPFEKDHKERHQKIGTAGGWVKASTGYSFKNAEKKSKEIVELITQGKPPQQLHKAIKYRHYDDIFLNVLHHRNDLGEKVFYQLYDKNNIQTLFRFLDDESSVADDLKIITSVTS
ncbi:MAG: lycopene cyclase, partial [Flavobacteriaceae bacterium]|nr:lycopene cyclase [Flavobacteriaceae bacterium]